MTLEDLLERHRNDLEKLNNQRKIWLLASSIVFCGIIFLIFGWEWLSDLQSKGIWWLVVSLMLIISINWWYWTMRVLRVIIHYQEIEYALIKEIYEDINVVKNNIKETFTDLTKMRP